MPWYLKEVLLLTMAFGVFCVALEIGYRVGLRHQPRDDEPAKSHANSLHNAVLGLLALLLGFTFAMAVSRYETRKTLMVDQANAIGTVAVRAKLLPPEQSARASQLIAEYVQTRLDYNASTSGSATLDTAEARAGAIETELWALGNAAIKADAHSQPASIYLQALNDVFDIREKRRFALTDQVPTAVVFLLYAVAVTSLSLVSYGCGLCGHRRLNANLTFAFLIAVVFIIILDIDRPRQGFVRVSQESLIRLQQSLQPAPTP